MKKAMIFAAGRGARMQGLTSEIPKPLVKVGNLCLIEYGIQALQRIGIQEIVINVCYLAEKIHHFLKDGSKYGVKIHYSFEDVALDTGGGMLHALPLLDDEPFIAMNCDVLCDFPLDQLQLPKGKFAHLVMVPNPQHNTRGDFSLIEGKVCAPETNTLTFSGIGVYHPDFLAGYTPHHFSLSSVILQRASEGLVSGELYEGAWSDVGTPERLAGITA